MKLLLVVVLISMFSTYSKATETKYYFVQRLDHFDNLNTGTFNQKYYVLDDYYNPNASPPAPVFLYINGEGINSITITIHFIIITLFLILILING